MPDMQEVLDRIPVEWGKQIRTGEGWYDLISDLDKQIAVLDPGYTIAQVKEKFGGLRFYIDEVNPDVRSQIEDLIKVAEGKAAKTCEDCGKPALLRRVNGWYSTLCDECFG